MHATLPLLENSTFPQIYRKKLEILQLNLGYLCNLSCVHCHVNAGPKRTELMTRATIEQVIQFIRREQIKILDLTGGAPEMNPEFRYLVDAARNDGVRVIDRCNLTILEHPEFDDLANYLANREVEITASLPCYIEDNVDRQRGKGVFDSSISALKRLNGLGYGKPESGLLLNLVFNPQGPVLPPPQQELETDYRRHLKEEFDIEFNELFTLANMPIQRFGSTLIGKGQFDEYMTLLETSFRPENLDSVMCINTLSVDWQGYVYDCDFNQMLGLALGASSSKRIHLSQLNVSKIEGQPVTVRQHCFGCTAGQGSSCSGALSKNN